MANTAFWPVEVDHAADKVDIVYTVTYTAYLKYIDWSVEKNEILKKDRGAGFDEIVDAIIADGLLKIIDHPNTKRYAHQRMFVVLITKYVYLVPFVEDTKKIFLKTLFRSRKATKQYIKKGE